MQKNWIWKTQMLAIVVLAVTSISFAQEGGEEEIDEQKSAELFLENYSDDFQEHFFEALKQKGIENYDKAINLLLECKKIDPANLVVDHELARVYLKEKQYPLAEDYAFAALSDDPENLWFANTYVETLRQQGKSFAIVKDKLPKITQLNENLALAYFKKRDLDTALAILKETTTSEFTKALSLQINDALEERKQHTVSSGVISTGNTTSKDTSSYEHYKFQIEMFLRTDNILMLDQKSEEALEMFPAQPLLYYAQGYALNRKSKPRDAIEMLETGLDYLVGDISLANKFYQELANAYNSINNSVKANMYLRKIKPGF